jgi:hypothetical protein
MADRHFEVDAFVIYRDDPHRRLTTDEREHQGDVYNSRAAARASAARLSERLR